MLKFSWLGQIKTQVGEFTQFLPFLYLFLIFSSDHVVHISLRKKRTESFTMTYNTMLTPGGNVVVGQRRDAQPERPYPACHNPGYRVPVYHAHPTSGISFRAPSRIDYTYSPRPAFVVRSASRMTATLSPKAAAIAALIGGIALTILGLCTLPFNPIAGGCIAGLGGLIALGGGILTPFVPWRA